MTTFILLLLAVTSVYGQNTVITERFNEDINFGITAEELKGITEFHMKNINGDLIIEGYEGNEIQITGNKKLTARPGFKGSVDPKDYFLEKVAHNNQIYVYIRQPGVEVTFKNGKFHYKGPGRMEDDYGQDRKPYFEFNLVLRVPHKLDSEFSTINGDEVRVRGMQSRLKLTNVNGQINAAGINNEIEASTVNGNIRVSYLESPGTDQDALFNTINGMIEVTAPADLAAIVTFQSMNGELFTDFNEVKRLPKKMIHDRDKDGRKRFRLIESEPFQIGEGGPKMHFQLLNGNAYLKINSSL